MTEVYNAQKYIELAAAVIAGMPMEEAEKILEKQRTVKARGEERFWLGLEAVRPEKNTTIQVTLETKDSLDHIKLASKESYNDVVKRLVKEHLRNRAAKQKSLIEATLENV